MKATATTTESHTTTAEAEDLNVIQLLHQDHDLVKDLFFQFSQSDDDKEKDKHLIY